MDYPAGFEWHPEMGRGFYPVQPESVPYDAHYFERYRERGASELGRELNLARLNLVERYYNGPVLDVGIGAGTFLELHGKGVGTDVNPAALAWLEGKDLLWGGERMPAATFWDSLEHIADPTALLALIDRLVFVSIPIFHDGAHVLRSKHFKLNEHFHFFTSWGFERFMLGHGFRLLESNTMETELGREDIGTFVFERT
jgi:SAM-dependent methyltransferase